MIIESSIGPRKFNANSKKLIIYCTREELLKLNHLYFDNFPVVSPFADRLKPDAHFLFQDIQTLAICRQEFNDMDFEEINESSFKCFSKVTNLEFVYVLLIKIGTNAFSSLGRDLKNLVFKVNKYCFFIYIFIKNILDLCITY